MKSVFLALLFISSFLLYAKVNMEQEYKELKTSTEQRLEEVQAKLEHLKIRSLELTGKAKVDLEEEYDELADFKDELEDRLEDAKDVGTEKWNAAKQRIKQMSSELERRIDNAENI